MNCCFCNKPLNIDLNSGTWCDTQECRNYYVIFLFQEHHTEESKTRVLYKVQLIGTIWNWDLKKEPRKYIVNFYPEELHTEIVEEIELPRAYNDESPYIKRDYKKVLLLPSSKPILTPTNFKTKLPTILTFS